MKLLSYTMIAILAFLLVASASFAHEGKHSSNKPSSRNIARKTNVTAKGKMLILQLKGLHCASCAMSVRSHLMKVSGVADASVNAEKQSATVTLAKGTKRPVDEALKSAVKAAGYSCILIKGG